MATEWAGCWLLTYLNLLFYCLVVVGAQHVAFVEQQSVVRILLIVLGVAEIQIGAVESIGRVVELVKAELVVLVAQWRPGGHLKYGLLLGEHVFG